MHTTLVRRLVVLLIAAGLGSAGLGLGSTAARAHAIVVSSQPAAGAVVPGKTVAVVVRFNSRIDPVRSRLLLVRADGTSTTLALADAQSPDTLAAAVGELAPGSYRLRWQVLAVDGHITRGDIPFTVAP
jgi:methionine-rich copper-binding protein CopC